MPRPESGKLKRWAALLLGMALCAPAGAETLTVVSWGGAYERMQTKAYFEPFTRATGIPVEVVQYNGGLDELREKAASGESSWDVIDLIKSDSLKACESGLLKTIDHDKLAPAPDGTPPEQDFYHGALGRCSVAVVIYATVLAFDVSAFPGRKPSSVSALFDLERFPGKRALQRRPVAILEWALRSYGVPRQDLYNLLSTERGLDLAFERLDSIKHEVVWWEDGAAPAELLASGEVVMASGYNGRFFDAAISDGEPIQTLWDGQLYDYSVLAIPRNAPNPELARRFIRYATTTDRLAAQTRYISYGPARRSASERVWKHADTGVDMRPHLPTYPLHFDRAIRKDHEWYARTQDRLRQRFFEWLAK